MLSIKPFFFLYYKFDKRNRRNILSFINFDIREKVCNVTDYSGSVIEHK